MDRFIVGGGRRLFGSIKIHGAKNSVLPILAAAILNPGISVLHNCPDLKDVDSAISILRHIGCHVKRETDTIIIDATGMSGCDIPDSMMREMRSSVIFLGPIIARFGSANMSFPGGCELGPRPIDLHLSSLSALGVDIREEGGNIICSNGKMVGKDISLSFPSVGATENIMLAATAAKGTTRIFNAAREPEIEDLQRFMIGLGFQVSGAGGSTIEIEGKKISPRRTEHTIIPDRIAAATYLCAAANCGGEIRLERADAGHVQTVLSTLSEAGAQITAEKDGSIVLKANRRLMPARPIRTMPYPGFPTDAQAPIMALMATAAGTTIFVENIFENRYRHVSELARMGADIKVAGKVAVVSGKPSLSGALVNATDLRGGAALVIAALGAADSSVISEIHHIDRGYEKMEQALAGLGADIRREF